MEDQRKILQPYVRGPYVEYTHPNRHPLGMAVSLSCSGPDDEYTDEQRLWLMAIQELKREVGQHPTWAQVLAKARQIGYRKVGTGHESWQ